jgi:lysophospholipase L1-like esterase
MTTARFVVCGDSLSAGVGDPAPRAAGRPNDLYGWVYHLMAQRPGIDLVANLSQIGATARRVRRHQSPLVAQHAPDVVTCIIGVNDVMSKHFEAAAFEKDYDDVIAVLTRSAARGVVTATLHDVAAGLPIGSRRRATLRQRIAEANEVIERVSGRYSCWLFDVRIGATMGELRMLSADRLHPNSRGHKYLAAHLADVLSRHGVFPRGPAVDAPAPFSGHQRLGETALHATWLIRNVLWPRLNRRPLPG